MKKRFVSLILTVFFVLSMLPYAAFADNAIVCPACGGEVTKHGFQLVGMYGYFYKCSSCSKWAFADGLGGLKILSVGDGEILNAANENTLLKFIFNNGHLIPAKQAPSGIGRKDLPGYADDNGTPSVGLSGQLQLTLEPLYVRFNSGFSIFSTSVAPSVVDEPTSVGWSNRISYSGSSAARTDFSVWYQFNAPAEGLYYIGSDVTDQKYVSASSFNGKGWNDSYLKFSSTSKYYKSISVKKGSVISVILGGNCFLERCPFKYTCYPITICYEPLGDSSVTTVNNITINNNTWNGNIYVDNSNNLTYIYPEYTTINESGDTVTNISTNPIIYNNETKQYYTYDSTTNNYYYITYGDTSATPTPSPSPEPTPTPDPGTDPTPTPTPGGGSGGGDGGDGGSGSGGSGSSWWEKLLDKLGSAIVDGLLGAISAVLKLIFKLFSTILGWIIWLASQVLTLFPFLPPGLGALLIGGVVVCFVIGIIKFIRG